MSRDPYGLGELLYAFAPADISPAGPGALLAMGSMHLTLVPDSHDGCGIATFCRNPLHPGPCKGWKRSLGKLAPGALTALEKARKQKTAERRVAREQARSTAAGKLTGQQLASPLHAKKATIKNANVLLGDTTDKARVKADRVILNKTEIKRYSRMKAAQLDALAAKHDVKALDMEGPLAQALANDNSSGRDMDYRATLEDAAQVLAVRIAKKLCKTGDGDCDGKPYEDLKKSLVEGLRPAVATGDDSELDGLVKARNGGQLLTPTGANPYTPTAPRPARPGPMLGPGRPNAAQKAQAKKAAQTLLNVPPPAPPTPAPAAPAAPATPKGVSDLQDLLKQGGYIDTDLLDALNNVTKAEHDTHLTDAERATIKARLDAMAGSSNQYVSRLAATTRMRLEKGNAKPAAPAAPAPTPSASPPAGASTAAQQAQAIATRRAPGAALAKKQVEVYEKLTKADFDALPDATQKQILADLKVAEARFLDPKKKKAAQDIHARLSGGTATPAAAPAAPQRSAVDNAKAVLGQPNRTDLEMAEAAAGLSKADLAKLDDAEIGELKGALQRVATMSGVGNGTPPTLTQRKAAEDTLAKLGMVAVPAKPTLKGDRTPLDPNSRHAADITRTLSELPADFEPDDQTRQQYVVQSVNGNVWHVGMGQPAYLQDKKTKAEALQWIVDAQRSREQLAKANAPAARQYPGQPKPPANMTPSTRDGEGVEVRTAAGQLIGEGTVVGKLDGLPNAGGFIIVRHPDGSYQAYAASLVKTVKAAPKGNPVDNVKRAVTAPNANDHAIAKAALDLTPADLAKLDDAEIGRVKQALDWIGGDPAATDGPAAKAKLAELWPKKAAAPNAPPAAPSPAQIKAGKAADLTARINEAATGVRMNAAGKTQLATALEAEHAKGGGAWAKAFADNTGANIGQKTKTYTQHALTSSQLAALKTELAEAIDGKRDDLPLLDAIQDAWKGNLTGAELNDKLNGMLTPAQPKSALDVRLDAARQMSHADLSRELVKMRVDHATKGPDRDAVDALHAEVAADPNRPNWLRLEAALNRPERDAKLAKQISDLGLQHSIHNATGEPSPYATTYTLADLFGMDEAKLAQAPDFVKGAYYDRRSDIVNSLFDRSGRTDRVITDVPKTIFSPGNLSGNKEPDLSRYETLTPDAQTKAQELMGRQIDNLIARDMTIQASEYQRAYDKIEGTKYNLSQKSAIRALHDGTGFTTGWDAKLDAYESLLNPDYDSLPDAHRMAIATELERLSKNTFAGVTDRAKAADVMAKFMDDRPDTGDPQLDGMIKGATYWADILDPSMRALALSFLTEAKFNKANNSQQGVLLGELRGMADGTTPGVSLGTRYSLQNVRDVLLKPNYNTAQKNAILDAEPGSHQTNAQRLTSYDKLTKTDHDQLPKAYREAIREDLDALVATDPALAGKVLQKIDPTWSPPYVAPTPSTHVTQSTDPAVQAALDVIYGIGGRKATQAEQFKVYSDLNKGHFDSLQPQEQQVLLGDLAYIATTAKSPATQKRASRLLDRFTPPGTPQGTVGSKQPILIPANAVAGQTLQPDPKGVAGLIGTKSSNPGVSGDEHTRTTSGGQGPWGKYGSAGIMLRHIDDSGVERFLMVERGPGISNSGKWQYPGGAIESKETMYEGASREVVEELGFKYSDLLAARVHGHHENLVPNIVGHPNGWLYTSIVATVDTQLKPDLSGWQARHETSDAKWMTAQEIEALDKGGKLLDPLAGGQVQKNVMTMFPKAVHSTGRPGAVTQRPARAKPPAPPTVHKPSIATNRIATRADHQRLSDAVKPLRGNYAGKVADERLAAIHNLQGFDRTPTVKTKAEMDALLATGEYIEIWRGVTPGNGKTSAQIAEEFRTGPNYGGFGVFGNGYYFAGDKALAQDYANPRSYRSSGSGAGAVIRALIPKSAVIADYKTLQAEQRNLFDGQYNPDAYRWQSKGGRTLHDEGRYASSKGVDTISIPAHVYKTKGGSGHLAVNPVHIVQNRSILIVEEA